MHDFEHTFALLVVHGIHRLYFSVRASVLVFSGQSYPTPRVVIVVVGLVRHLAVQASLQPVSPDGTSPLLAIAY